MEFKNCSFATEEILYDPQTSGGLLASVDKEDVPAIMEELEKLGLPCGVVGEILPKQEKAITSSRMSAGKTPEEHFMEREEEKHEIR